MAVPSVHNGGAFGGGQQMVAQANQRRRGDFVSEASGASREQFLGLQEGFAHTQFLRNGTHVFAVNLNDQLFDRFAFDAVDFAVDHLGAANFQLETFAAHSLDEYREVKFTASGNFIAQAIRSNRESNVGFEFFVQTVGNLARSGELTFLTFERRSIRTDVDRERGLFQLGRCQGRGVIASGDGVADFGGGNARNSHDVASAHLGGFFLAQTPVSVEAVDFGV